MLRRLRWQHKQAGGLTLGKPEHKLSSIVSEITSFIKGDKPGMDKGLNSQAPHRQTSYVTMATALTQQQMRATVSIRAPDKVPTINFNLHFLRYFFTTAYV